MRIITSYVSGQLLKVFSALIVALTLMLVVVGVVEHARKYGLGHEQIVKILPWVVPSLLPYTIPATLLLTVCVVYGRMAGDQEITAIKSAGISVMVVLRPAFILASLLSLGTFLLSDYFIPLATSRIEQIITLAMEDIFLDVLRTTNQFTEVNRGISITVDRVDGKTLINPVFRYTPPGGHPNTLRARTATLKFDMQRKEVLVSFESAFLEVPGGHTVVLNREQRFSFPLPINVEAPKARNIPIEMIHRDLAAAEAERDRLIERRVIATAFGLTLGDFNRLAPQEMLEFERKLNNTAERHNKLRTAIHERISLACSCFFFTLVGAPFAVMQSRRQFLTSFALCFAPILTFYYPIELLTMSLGKEGKLDPAYGMWLANVLMAGAAAVVLKKVTQH